MGRKSRQKWLNRGGQPQDQGVEINRIEYSGPLPPPGMLERYNQAFPGCAERIVALVEKQSDHRQTLEKRKLNSDIISERFGTIFGFIIVMTALAFGFYLILHDKAGAGLATIITALAALAAVFVYGRHVTRKEREAKLRQP